MEKNVLTLAFYEALYLADKQALSVKDKKGAQVDFQALLKAYEKADGNAWTHFLVYRDLRSRGYVVREGFGVAIDFRIYERGTYGKDNAASLRVLQKCGFTITGEDKGYAAPMNFPKQPWLDNFRAAGLRALRSISSSADAASSIGSAAARAVFIKSGNFCFNVNTGS